MDAFRVDELGPVVFFTGAGISAESGVPTYRGAGGIWGQYRWEEYACQRALDADPDKVLDFHEQRRARVLACEPNAGHRHLAGLQAAIPEVTIVTQNTDGLHARAGGRDVIELHGSLWRLRCPRHGVREDLAAGPYRERRCGRCGTALRPDITWFEDAVDAEVFRRAQRRPDGRSEPRGDGDVGPLRSSPARDRSERAARCVSTPADSVIRRTVRLACGTSSLA